jgi:hypothetical protein
VRPVSAVMLERIVLPTPLPSDEKEET